MAASFEYQALRYRACEYFAFVYKDRHLSIENTVFDIRIRVDYPVHLFCVLGTSLCVCAVTREDIILIQLDRYILLHRLVLSE